MSGYLGNKPSAVPLTSADITDGIITSAKIANDAVTSSKIADGTIVNADINASATISTSKLGVGAVLQVVSTVKTADQSTTSTSPVDVTDLSLNITPSSASNKVLVLVNINNIGNSIANTTHFRILRGATVLTSNSSGGLADTKDAFGSGGGGGMSHDDRKIGSASITFLDTPSSTSALTYKVTFEVDGGTGTINRWQLNTDVASVSTLTLMEIKG